MLDLFYSSVFAPYHVMLLFACLFFQAIKCCLADLPQSIGMWTPDAVLWLRDSVLNCSDCSIKVSYLTVPGMSAKNWSSGLHG